MNLRPMLIVNGLLVAVMAGISIWAWGVIPENAQIPIHFNIHGTPDRLGSKEELLFLIPATAVLLTALMWFLPRLDPRRANLEASSKFWNAASILTVGLLGYAHGLLVWNVAVHPIDTVSALVPALSILFIGLGNYLGKTKANWFGGVRTPWSLSSDYSWEKTHRWGGRMMVASGLIALAAWFLVDAKLALFVLVSLIVATAFASILLSYVFWRADPDRVANGASH